MQKQKIWRCSLWRESPYAEQIIANLLKIYNGRSLGTTTKWAKPCSTDPWELQRSEQSPAAQIKPDLLKDQSHTLGTKIMRLCSTIAAQKMKMRITWRSWKLRVATAQTSLWRPEDRQHSCNIKEKRKHEKPSLTSADARPEMTCKLAEWRRRLPSRMKDQEIISRWK
jgi:hypothetical protein